MAEALRLELGPELSVEWELEALMRAADAADPSAPAAWRLEADWSALDSLRLISCAVGDEAVAIVVARPVEASRHDRDLIAGVRIRPAGVDAAEDVFLSTEYDAEGQVRRIGVELWLASGAAARVAADRSGDGATSRLDGLEREGCPMRFRLDGVAGAGLHELVRPVEA